jgi:predicted lysophospholipase L1 biosynthesis ABC-type transport system permease subunit
MAVGPRAHDLEGTAGIGSRLGIALEHLAQCATSIIFADVLPHRKPLLEFYPLMFVVASPF